MNLNVLVSIVIPTNNVRYLIETLNSISLDGIECETILVLDQIELDSHALIEKYSGICLRVIQNEGFGISDALNTGVKASRGDFILRIDSDDLMLPHRIQNQLKFLLENSKVAAVGGQMFAIDAGGRRFKEIRYPVDIKSVMYEIHFHSALPHPGVMIRKSAFLKIGGYRNCFPHVEDWDLWLRLMEVGDLANLEIFVTNYRIHDFQITKLKSENMQVSKEAVILSKSLRVRGLQDVPDVEESLESWVAKSKSTIHDFDRRENFAMQLVALDREIENIREASGKVMDFNRVFRLLIRHPYLFCYTLLRKLKERCGSNESFL